MARSQDSHRHHRGVAPIQRLAPAELTVRTYPVGEPGIACVGMACRSAVSPRSASCCECPRTLTAAADRTPSARCRTIRARQADGAAARRRGGAAPDGRPRARRAGPRGLSTPAGANPTVDRDVGLDRPLRQPSPCRHPPHRMVRCAAEAVREARQETLWASQPRQAQTRERGTQARSPGSGSLPGPCHTILA